ncbi:LysR family transcriptional regulator [Larsenimonas suaedae]|uniref:LysR family transcriptional regulator n=1 Tax=Larsenimonas suaedae TaxID=1851019 RepID=A0ABU1GUK2_9GAMM|nr:LysR family transcriptional regulator [Larsenimonas suaedae]MCM2972143.1 LysR family transcriptional regulator [Larsenimonas suaedae]MDR5895063.1 LysR family transcriptional regulator [Larsenimonas suaedae]
MDHRQLRFLVALARERHFGRAAERVNVTQPTLSARLKQLEQELGTPLIRRGRRFEGFTQEGQRVLAHARRILSEFDELYAELDPTQGPSGWLTIGIVPSALGEVASRLAGLRTAFPSLRLRVREYTALALMQALADEEVDLAISYLDLPAAEPFVARPLFEEQYSVLASPSVELSEPVDWASLAGQPLYMLTSDMQQHQLIRARLEREGANTEAVVEVDSMAMLIVLLKQDRAVTVVPERLAATLTDEPLTCHALPSLPAPSRLGLLWKRRDYQLARLSAVLGVF